MITDAQLRKLRCLDRQGAAKELAAVERTAHIRKHHAAERQHDGGDHGDAQKTREKVAIQHHLRSSPTPRAKVP